MVLVYIYWSNFGIFNKIHFFSVELLLNYQGTSLSTSWMYTVNSFEYLNYAFPGFRYNYFVRVWEQKKDKKGNQW